MLLVQSYSRCACPFELYIHRLFSQPMPRARSWRTDTKEVFRVKQGRSPTSFQFPEIESAAASRELPPARKPHSFSQGVSDLHRNALPLLPCPSDSRWNHALQRTSLSCTTSGDRVCSRPFEQRFLDHNRSFFMVGTWRWHPVDEIRGERE